MPQVLTVITPMLGNYVIVTFKETAILSTITVSEMLSRSMEAGYSNFRFIEPLTMAGALYFAISYAAARGIRAYENYLRG